VRFADRLRRLRSAGLEAGRVAAELAMRQPEVRVRVERAQAQVEELRRELEARLAEAEAQAYAWMRKMEEEARRSQRQLERHRSADEHYRTLGLNPGAGLDDVKKAYRRLMRDHHPDRHAHDARAESAAHARAQRINAAYVELTALLTGRESRTA
jgi:DnaJ-domain-containing protein 1